MAGGRVVPLSSSPRRVARTAYRWPLAPQPAVLRRFVVGPQRWSPGHRGVDLTAAVGDDVLAAAPGVVTFAGMVAGRGVVAVLHADGIRTTYEPVAATVSAGDAVAGGAPLGRLAPGAHCTGSCLHWGALRGDSYLDPLSLLAPPAPPVLLPLGTSRPSTQR
jgi:murein DD-endopeptidase MepM/ murein hydrolase activator NlpD